MRVLQVLVGAAALLAAAAIGPVAMAAHTPDSPAVLQLVRGGGGGGGHGGGGHGGGGYGGGGYGGGHVGGHFGGHDDGHSGGYAWGGGWGYHPWVYGRGYGYGIGGYPYAYSCMSPYAYPYCAWSN